MKFHKFDIAIILYYIIVYSFRFVFILILQNYHVFIISFILIPRASGSERPKIYIIYFIRTKYHNLTFSWRKKMLYTITYDVGE